MTTFVVLIHGRKCFDMGRKRTYQPEQILVALERYAVQHGRAPTIEEFRQALGVGSSRTVLRYLRIPTKATTHSDGRRPPAGA
jgi:hypothetical protein